MFQYCTSLENLNAEFDTRTYDNSIEKFNKVFYGCKKLKTIGKITMIPRLPIVDAFYGCNALENIEFEPKNEGESVGIGHSISFADSPKLSIDSMKSVLKALVTKPTSGATVVFNQEAVHKFYDDSKTLTQKKRRSQHLSLGSLELDGLLAIKTLGYEYDSDEYSYAPTPNLNSSTKLRVDIVLDKSTTNLYVDMQLAAEKGGLSQGDKIVRINLHSDGSLEMDSYGSFPKKITFTSEIANKIIV